MPITLFHIRHAGLHVRRFRDLHPPASRCGICLRRCSRIFTGLLFFPSDSLPASRRAACLSERRKRWHMSLPERSSKIALFVSSCVSAFSLLLPSTPWCTVKYFYLTPRLLYTPSPPFCQIPLCYFFAVCIENPPPPFSRTPPHRHAFARGRAVFGK